MIQKIEEFFNRNWERLLDFIGDVKVFKFPFFAVYDPSFFQMTGEKIEEALKILQPGDIILRGYDCYLDGHFIDGDYSHGAIYIGDNTIVHAVSPTVTRIHAIEFMECDRIVILRPNGNIEKAIEKAIEFADNKIPYDFFFEADKANRLYCFELVATCYSDIEFKKFEVSQLFGLLKKDVYLSKSFLESEKVVKVFEYNPRLKRCFSTISNFSR